MLASLEERPHLGLERGEVRLRARVVGALRHVRARIVASSPGAARLGMA